ncbi:hypothetical protein F4781DRAFT_403979 [Annulohypoxylon bovei var. microspora]|nr:hypothetical protein F4781DRAFT_403979 [Annulohypoxylon bovei var. microspora]
MPPNTGLRVARVHPLFLGHGPGLHTPVLAPLFTTPHSYRKRLAPPRPSAQRAASTKSQAQENKAAPPQSISELTSSTTRPTSPLPPSTFLNPPASTRPPPLVLPTRDPSTSTISYWYQYGKAYTTFYKTGLRAIFTNRRLLAQSPSASTPTSSTLPTRSDSLLRQRVRHDLPRLPAFGLLLLLFGELTPFVVLAFPRLTPYTCRIPTQVDVLQRGTEARRAASAASLARVQGPARGSLASGHVCRSLGLTNALWDRVGLDSPFGAAAAARAVRRIAADDAMIRDGGAVADLVDEEVVLACEDRGMYVRGKSVEGLRGELEEWLRKSAPEKRGKDDASKEVEREEAEDKVRGLLLGLDGEF